MRLLNKLLAAGWKAESVQECYWILVRSGAKRIVLDVRSGDVWRSGYQG